MAIKPMVLGLVGRRTNKRICVKVGRRVYCGRRVKRQARLKLR